ncbi:hypothetical protein DEU56DRAFT_807650 [Suillus clintonianus]|uniref:uncharacterized protein n=1 Tax=Suillus clintonianus TaxID=1904413 RepID=UPI001B88367E|nr:uncharacterized protein DEU56DRAFT_807650 [Suillus clintonianus]KAG2135331.1 hypothetical protein DEU56DRAFT_807650 [Suillus clintonianus]
MLRWQSLALQVTLAACVLASTDPSLESKEPSDALPECQARAWVRAPDMVPGDIIAGDVRIKLSGPCTDVESYVLGLRYKENIFWKLRSIGFTRIIRDTCSLDLSHRRQDAPIPIPKQPEFKYDLTDSNYLFQVQMPFYTTADYNETEWATYQNSVQNKELWSLHEEERIAFEIKTPLVGENLKGTDPLLRVFASRFGILVPNTNYPPGLDFRPTAWSTPPTGATDAVSTESIYEYFVEIRFGNGTISETPAGITSFTPLYLSTKDDTLKRNISVVPQISEPVIDVLRSNYTIELSFPSRVNQNSSVNITATVHRTGYTNRTDAPIKLCAFLNSLGVIEWRHQELKNRSHLFGHMINALVPSVEHSSRSPPFFSHPCREINFEAAPVDLTREGRISSSSSEPLSLSVHIRGDAVPDFLAYYCQKLGYDLGLNLEVNPDPSEPWEHMSVYPQWEEETAGMDESDFHWAPWLPVIQTPRRFIRLTGDVSLPVISMQKRCPVRSTPVHYLSDEARQPAFVDVSDIVDLRSMSPEERDLLAPFAQPSIKVFAKGEELYARYFSDIVTEEQLIYAGDAWAKKVLSLTAEGPRKKSTVDHSVLMH